MGGATYNVNPDGNLSTGWNGANERHIVMAAGKVIYSTDDEREAAVVAGELRLRLLRLETKRGRKG